MKERCTEPRHEVDSRLYLGPSSTEVLIVDMVAKAQLCNVMEGIQEPYVPCVLRQHMQ